MLAETFLRTCSGSHGPGSHPRPPGKPRGHPPLGAARPWYPAPAIRGRRGRHRRRLAPGVARPHPRRRRGAAQLRAARVPGHVRPRRPAPAAAQPPPRRAHRARRAGCASPGRLLPAQRAARGGLLPGHRPGRDRGAPRQPGRLPGRNPHLCALPPAGRLALARRGRHRARRHPARPRLLAAARPAFPARRLDRPRRRHLRLSRPRTVPAPQAPPALRELRAWPWRVLVLASLVGMLVDFDGTVLYLALPAIAADFHAPVAELTQAASVLAAGSVLAL